MRLALPTIPRGPGWWALLGALWGIALLAGCLGDRVAGGGTEGTNGNIVAGRLKYADGAPGRHARLWIRPVDYLKDTSEIGESDLAPDAVSDAEGRFTLGSLPAGAYLLEARDSSGNGMARTLSADGPFTELSPDTLHALGAIEGRLERLGNVPQRAFARIYGMDRVVLADTTGAFTIPNLPPSQYRIQGVSSLPGHGFQKPVPVLVSPADTTDMAVLPLVRSLDEDYSDWPFSRRLRLSTDSIPAGALVTDFPLLVRLDAGNFDFSLSNGNDIRFSAADGRHLAFEVERWDAGARQAEIWVKLDSIVGGSPVYLNMHWGRLQSPDFSFGPSVFQTFGGVWHLQEAPGLQQETSARDASPYAATAVGLTETPQRTGLIGNAAGFKGTHFLKVGGHAGLKPPSRFTVSAWIRVEGIPKSGAEIISMGDNYALRVEQTGIVHFFYFNDKAWTSGAPVKNESWVNARSADRVDDQAWHLVAGVLAEDSLRLYVDGLPRAASASNGEVAYVLGQDLYIGKHGDPAQPFYFNGQIDEPQVHGVPRSPAWIKLAFETQKPGSAALRFE